MAKTPFYYLPMNTLQGRLLGYWLSIVFGCLANLRLIVELIRLGPTKYFSVSDRTGANRPAKALDAHGSHQFISLPKAGIKLHYVEAGNTDGQLMLFVHGFPECWFSWRYQLAAFKERGYHTVAVNMRGYGESDKPKGVANYSYDLLLADLVELIELLVSDKKSRKCVLVAHDWGGLIAWTVAQTRPDLVDRFIVLNAPHADAWMGRIGTSWKQFFSSWYMFFFNVPCLAEVSIRSGDFKIFDVLFAKYSRSAEETAVYKHYFSLPYGTTAPLNYYRARLRGYGEIPPFSRPIQVRTLILWGRNDQALIEQLAGDSARFCAQPTVHYIDNCSHWIQLERPDEVNKLMADFLQQK